MSNSVDKLVREAKSKGKRGTEVNDYVVRSIRRGSNRLEAAQDRAAEGR